MEILKAEVLQIKTSNDIVGVRQAVRARALEQGFGIIDQTKIITAASELARNTLDYGKGGTVRIESLRLGMRKGLRLAFEDQGPGIPDVSVALQDGYTTGGGLGLGLSGARRLVSEFEIASSPGAGTRVVITKWL